MVPCIPKFLVTHHVLLLRCFQQHENDVSGLRRYDLQSWWGKDWNGSGVRVAVVDDGLDYRHDDLKDVYVSLVLQWMMV